MHLYECDTFAIHKRAALLAEQQAREVKLQLELDFADKVRQDRLSLGSDFEQKVRSEKERAAHDLSEI